MSSIESSPENVKKFEGREGFQTGDPVKLKKPHMITLENGNKAKITEELNQGEIVKIEGEKAKVEFEFLGTAEIPLEKLKRKY